MKIRDRSQLSLRLATREDDRAPLTVWIDPDEPDGDSFAGGGGAGLGVKQAYEELGIERRAQRIAVNHWPEALAMYTANHPGCRVFCEDVLEVDPVVASGGKRYVLAWFSPTCIFFSQARGGSLDVEEATRVRGLAEVAITWARSAARPRVTCLENVKQFERWGPLHRTHNNGCSAELALSRATISKKGKVTPKCLKGCHHGRPMKARRGEFFRAFVADLRECYRYVEWRCLRAHDYGAPTSRERFFLIASDEPVVWPTPTHGPGREHPHWTAAECIDWTIPCPSIFERKEPLVDTTLARIRTGIERFVFGAARPFIVHLTHGAREHDIDASAPTVTCANRGELGLVTPTLVRSSMHMSNASCTYPAREPLRTITTDGGFGIATPVLVHRSNGERPGQTPRAYDVAKPIGTLVGTEKHALALPVLVRNYSERDGGFVGAKPVDESIPTITQRDHHSIAMVGTVKLRGTSDAHVAASAGDLDAPLDTIGAGGTHHAVMAAYLLRYNGTSTGQDVRDPLSTVDTRDRFALVTLTMEREVTERAMRVAAFLGYDAPIVLEIDGEQWVLVDIGFRMLVARELFLCQGFPPEWRIDIDFNGKPLSKTAQIKCVGNSVPPQLAKVVAMAAIRTVRYEPEMRRAA